MGTLFHFWPSQQNVYREKAKEPDHYPMIPLLSFFYLIFFHVLSCDSVETRCWSFPKVNSMRVKPLWAWTIKCQAKRTRGNLCLDLINLEAVVVIRQQIVTDWLEAEECLKVATLPDSDKKIKIKNDISYFFFFFLGWGE